VSAARQQALVESSLEQVWPLIGDPRRHPEWWPRVIEVHGTQFEQGMEYRQITKMPLGNHETTLMVDRLDDLKSIRMRCLDTGTYADWRVTPAQSNTFLEVELGMEPIGVANRVFDATAGTVYFRRWLQESIDALKAAVEHPR
jgi:Polyketide cyclase / dehydrase and lipid transport